MNTWPNFEQHKTRARRLLTAQGAEALRNPHAMIGRACMCRDCFCCAALQVYQEHSGRSIEPPATMIRGRV